MKNKYKLGIASPLLLLGFLTYGAPAFSNPCDVGAGVQTHANRPGVGGTGNSMDPGVGGTGRNLEPGIGGTGRSKEPGLGGTGSARETVETESFVYGVITGFASICVNGVEIEYTPDTTVTSNGESASVQSLKIGQWVAVNGAGKGREMNASSISIEQPLGGPVTRVDSANRTIEVMGQTVRLGQGAGVRNLPKVGDSISVSGFKLPNGEIQSSRIDPLPANVPSFV